MVELTRDFCGQQIVFAMIFAVAQAAAILYTSAGHIPYSHGWTDGPNNGVGPTVLLHAPLAYSGLGLGHTIVV